MLAGDPEILVTSTFRSSRFSPTRTQARTIIIRSLNAVVAEDHQDS
jgi:hypothetical protein